MPEGPGAGAVRKDNSLPMPFFCRCTAMLHQDARKEAIKEQLL